MPISAIFLPTCPIAILALASHALTIIFLLLILRLPTIYAKFSGFVSLSYVSFLPVAFMNHLMF